MQFAETAPVVAIACGGTGGHLFPGLAVAESLDQRGGIVSLLVSSKEVDQQAVKSTAGIKIVTLPAVGLTRRSVFAFAQGFWKSYRVMLRNFSLRRPAAVLAMGGFTSAPAILAGKRFGAATFLHESNSIPGRATRWLGPKVNHVFVGFPGSAARISNRRVTVTGTPVRPRFRQRDTRECRLELGLDPSRPTLLVVGGSQGASGINHRIIASLPPLAEQMPAVQFLHLTGANDFEEVRQTYAKLQLKAVVRPFLTEMELALGGATVAISRSGASSLAEFAAMRLPAVLVPYPAAIDNHQFFNAQALVQSGAARMLEQEDATPASLIGAVRELIENAAARESMRAALAKWHRPDAAENIANRILAAIVEDVATGSESAHTDRRVQNGGRLQRQIEAPPRAPNSEPV